MLPRIQGAQPRDPQPHVKPRRPLSDKQVKFFQESDPGDT